MVTVIIIQFWGKKWNVKTQAGDNAYSYSTMPSNCKKCHIQDAPCKLKHTSMATRAAFKKEENGRVKEKNALH